MAKKAVAPVEDDDEIAELEELDTEVTEEAPAKGKAKAKAKVEEEEIWGVRDLIALIKSKTEKEYSPREVRTLLRKLAREGGGVEREIIAGNKARYAWTGPKDPEVKAILASVENGDIEASKKAALDKLKADKAAKNAAAAKVAAKAAKNAAPADDEDED